MGLRTLHAAAAGLAGVRCSMLLDGAVNRAAFEAFVEQVLVPALRPGDADGFFRHCGYTRRVN